MTHTKIPKGENGQGGKGYWFTFDQDGEGLIIVNLVCPVCGGLANLGVPSVPERGSGHTIAADGTVSPSVVCPFECPFHEFVQLEDWTPVG